MSNGWDPAPRADGPTSGGPAGPGGPTGGSSGFGGLAGPGGPEQAGRAWQPPTGGTAPGGSLAGATGATGGQGGGARGAGPQPAFGPDGMAAGQQPAPGAPGAVRTPNIAQLAAARQAANNAIQKGWLLIGLGIAITIGTFVLAPGGFFIISFGPVIAGINNVSRGRKHLQKVHAVERQLFPHGPQRY